MISKIQQVIEGGKKGLIFKNSLYLPFHLELISVWAGKDMSLVAKPDIYTNFHPRNEEVLLREGASYTNLVFLKYKDLQKEFGHHKGHVILYASEKGDDIFDPGKRHYLNLSFPGNNNIVNMELIDDPFLL